LFQIRVAFVGYRDYDDGSERVVKKDFTENTNDVINFMNSVSAFGGADACEDIFGGLEEVTKLDWISPNRILIHVADAPQHGSR
jgi:hypothetical protein